MPCDLMYKRVMKTRLFFIILFVNIFQTQAYTEDFGGTVTSKPNWDYQLYFKCIEKKGHQCIKLEFSSKNARLDKQYAYSVIHIDNNGDFFIQENGNDSFSFNKKYINFSGFEKIASDIANRAGPPREGPFQGTTLFENTIISSVVKALEKMAAPLRNLFKVDLRPQELREQLVNGLNHMTHQSRNGELLLHPLTSSYMMESISIWTNP